MAPTKAVTLRSETAVSQVKPEQTLKASTALLAHMKKAAKEKAQTADKKDLLAASDDDEASDELPIWLTLTTKRHISDTRSLKPGKVVLPHPLNTDPQMSVCIITAEPQRAYKNLVASDAFPVEWRKRVGRVIDVGKLKKKFKTYEAQRMPNTMFSWEIPASSIDFPRRSERRSTSLRRSGRYRLTSWRGGPKKTGRG
jgi:ribosome biogenesis protein UTP30